MKLVAIAPCGNIVLYGLLNDLPYLFLYSLNGVFITLKPTNEHIHVLMCTPSHLARSNSTQGFVVTGGQNSTVVFRTTYDLSEVQLFQCRAPEVESLWREPHRDLLEDYCPSPLPPSSSVAIHIPSPLVKGSVTPPPAYFTPLSPLPSVHDSSVLNASPLPPSISLASFIDNTDVPSSPENGNAATSASTNAATSLSVRPPPPPPSFSSSQSNTTTTTNAATHTSSSSTTAPPPPLTLSVSAPSTPSVERLPSFSASPPSPPSSLLPTEKASPSSSLTPHPFTPTKESQPRGSRVSAALRRSSLPLFSSSLDLPSGVAAIDFHPSLQYFAVVLHARGGDDPRPGELLLFVVPHTDNSPHASAVGFHDAFGQQATGLAKAASVRRAVLEPKRSVLGSLDEVKEFAMDSVSASGSKGLELATETVDKAKTKILGVLGGLGSLFGKPKPPS